MTILDTRILTDDPEGAALLAGVLGSEAKRARRLPRLADRFPALTPLADTAEAPAPVMAESPALALTAVTPVTCFVQPATAIG